MPITIQCGIFAILAQLFSVFMNIYNAKGKAKLANLIFSWKDYFSQDGMRIGAILCVIVMWLILMQYIKLTPLEAIAISGLIGYAGQDVALRFFSKVNQSLNAAIDFKTTQADKASGNLDNPTPAAPVK